MRAEKLASTMAGRDGNCTTLLESQWAIFFSFNWQTFKFGGDCKNTYTHWSNNPFPKHQY